MVLKFEDHGLKHGKKLSTDRHKDTRMDRKQCHIFEHRSINEKHLICVSPIGIFLRFMFHSDHFGIVFETVIIKSRSNSRSSGYFYKITYLNVLMRRHLLVKKGL
jgi:hypothetical protein